MEAVGAAELVIEAQYASISNPRRQQVSQPHPTLSFMCPRRLLAAPPTVYRDNTAFESIKGRGGGLETQNSLIFAGRVDLSRSCGSQGEQFCLASHGFILCTIWRKLNRLRVTDLGPSEADSSTAAARFFRSPRSGVLPWVCCVGFAASGLCVPLRVISSHRRATIPSLSLVPKTRDGQ